MNKSILSLAVIAVLNISCSNMDKEIELYGRILELETQLDECMNGSDKLLARLNVAFDEKNYNLSKSIFEEIKNRHPESAEYEKAVQIANKIEAIEKQERIERERAEAAIKAEKERALKRLKKDYDDVSGITWYKQNYFTHYTNTNLTSIYIGTKDLSQWLRLKMSFQGDDWIFFENAYLSYDGNTKEIKFDKYRDKETNVRNGVSEWIDVSIDSSTEEFLRSFAKSKNAKMRLSGKFVKTRNLTKNERQGILDVLNGYDVLKSRFK